MSAGETYQSYKTVLGRKNQKTNKTVQHMTLNPKPLAKSTSQGLGGPDDFEQGLGFRVQGSGFRFQGFFEVSSR